MSDLRDRAKAVSDPVIASLVKDLTDCVVQVSTSDGYVVARHLTDGMHDKKLSALSASLVALADSVTKELQVGGPENLVIEAELGAAVALRVSRHLLLLAATKRGTSLGILLSRTKAAAEEIRVGVGSD